MFCLPKAWCGDSSLDCSGRWKAEHTMDQGQHGSVSWALDNSCNPYLVCVRLSRLSSQRKMVICSGPSCKAGQWLSQKWSLTLKFYSTCTSHQTFTSWANGWCELVVTITLWTVLKFCFNLKQNGIVQVYCELLSLFRLITGFLQRKTWLESGGFPWGL